MGKAIFWAMAWLMLLGAPLWASPPLGEFHLFDERGNCLVLQPDARQFCWTTLAPELIQGKLVIITERNERDEIIGFRFQEGAKQSRLKGQIHLDTGIGEATLTLVGANGQGGRELSLSPRPFLRAGCGCEVPKAPVVVEPAKPVPMTPLLPQGQGTATVLPYMPSLLPKLPDLPTAPAPRHLGNLLVMTDDRRPDCVVLRLPNKDATSDQVVGEFCWNRPEGISRGRALLRLSPATGTIEEVTLLATATTATRMTGTISLKRRRARLALLDQDDKELATLVCSNIDAAVCDCSLAEPPPSKPIAAVATQVPSTASTAPVLPKPTTPPPVNAPPLTIERGRIVPGKPFLMQATVLHAGMNYGGAYRMPITLKLWLGHDVFEPWGPADQPVAGDLSRAEMPRFVTKVVSPGGTPVAVGLRLWRRVRPWETAVTASDWEGQQTIEAGEASRQMLILKRGEALPPTLLGTPESGGPPTWLRPYVKDGKAELGPGELLMVVELSSNDLTSPLVDYRELALLFSFQTP
jgi:hypothetical protein